MATPLDPIKIHPRLGMLSQVDASLLTSPDSGYVKEQINMHSDVIGQTKTRDGLTIIGAQIQNDKPILGLYNFRDSGSGVNNQLVAVVSDGANDVYYDNSGTWTKITGMTDRANNRKTRFATFSDQMIVVSSGDDMVAWSGTGSAITSGNPLNVDDIAGTDNQYIETMLDRVFVAGEIALPDRLYFSSTADTSGNIVWDGTLDDGFIDISLEDGDNITGLKRYGTVLLIFKKNYLYRLTGTGLTTAVDPDPIINIGTYSQESVVEGKGGIYYHHPKGFFVYSGGFPQEISKGISDWIDAITVANYEEIAGWADADHVYWSVGDVTVGGVAFTNIVLVYTISSKVWFVYSYPEEITIGVQNLGTGTSDVWESVVGTDDGNIYQFNTGTTDASSAIDYSITTHFYDFGLISAHKIINRLMVASDTLNSAVIMWQRRGDNANQWNTIGQLVKYHNPFKDTNIKGNEIRFRIQGSRTGVSGYFRFIDILDVMSEGVIN